MFIKANGHGYVNTDYIRWFELRVNADGQTDIIANIGDESIRIETHEHQQSAVAVLNGLIRMLDKES